MLSKSGSEAVASLRSICSTCQSSRSTVAPRPRNRTTATNWSRFPRRITVPSTPVSGPVVIRTLAPTGTEAREPPASRS